MQLFYTRPDDVSGRLFESVILLACSYLLFCGFATTMMSLTYPWMQPLAIGIFAATAGIAVFARWFIRRMCAML